jgi:hypothetical protein
MVYGLQLGITDVLRHDRCGHEDEIANPSWPSPKVGKERQREILLDEN